MAVILHIKIPGVSLEQYDKVRELTNFEGDAPAGGIYHACAHDGNGLRITDVWETQGHFDAFLEQRLGAAMQEAGINVQPEIEALPVHNLFASGYK